MMRTEQATEAIMRAKDLRVAGRLRERGWLVFDPMRVVSCKRSEGVMLVGEPDEHGDCYAEFAPDRVVIEVLGEVFRD